MRSLALTAIVLAVAAPLQASAGVKISIPAFSGPGGNQLRDDIVTLLCEVESCVPQARIIKSGRVDWRKVKSAGVDVILLGHVSGSKRKQSLQLTLLSSPKEVHWTHKVSVSNGQMALKALSVTRAKISVEIAKLGRPGEENIRAREEESLAEVEPVAPPKSRKVVAAAPAEPEDEEAEEEEAPKSARRNEPEDEEEERKPAKVASSRTRYSDDIRSDEDADEDEGSGATEVTRSVSPEGREAAASLVVVRAGLETMSRKFNYVGGASSNLVPHDAGGLIGPHVRAEVTPLAKLKLGTPAILNPLGAELSFTYAPLQRTERSDGTAHRAGSSQLDIGAFYRYQLPQFPALVLHPSVGFRSASFVALRATPATAFDRPPAVTYRSLRLTAGAELRFSDNQFKVATQLSYLPVMSTGEIISEKFFTRGSASAFELTGGLSYRFLGSFEAGLTGAITRYGISFQSAEEDLYIARGAVDQRMSAQLTVGYIY